MLKSIVRKLPPIRRLISERDELRARVSAQASAQAAPIGSNLIETDYAYRPAPRPLETSVGGKALLERLSREQDAYAATLRTIGDFQSNLAAILPDALDQPHWRNPWLPGLDAAAIYALVASTRPRRYIEVGSGMSTRFAARAIADHGLATEIVSIDPEPRADIAALCSRTHRQPLEDVASSLWDDLSPQDLIFFDGSHRAFQNSDVTVFFTEIVPAMPPGLIYGIHDICLPFDYPAEWSRRFYNEQYMLAAYLLGGGGGDEIVLPAFWTSQQPQLADILRPLWDSENLAGTETHGGAFWLRRGQPQR